METTPEVRLEVQRRFEGEETQPLYIEQLPIGMWLHLDASERPLGH